MRILVTGACGFVGRHLVAELLAHRHEPVALDLGECPADFPATVSYHRGDIANAGQLRQAVAEIRPEGCIHLAGLAFVPIGWSDPARMMQVNLIGAINLLEALRHGAPEARLLLISSAEVYGRKSLSAPLTEDARCNLIILTPCLNPLLRAWCFFTGDPMDADDAARPCNHIGRGSPLILSFLHLPYSCGKWLQAHVRQ